MSVVDPTRSHSKDLKLQDLEKHRQHARVVALINGFFFLYAGVAAIWLLWMVFEDTRKIHWLAIVYLVLLWAILAYWVLPRFHKVLTTLYVPYYFIGRSRTEYGLLGDAINLAFEGSEDSIHQAMQAAGWELADPLSLKSSLKIVGATLAGRSYSKAPVSTLMLFGRPQDFAYQQQVDGSPGKRHHIRFWKCPPDWPLPGGRRVDWLAAASYDKSVGLSLFTLQVTHKISSDIDGERDHVIATLQAVEPDMHVVVIKDFSTAYHARNGGGDLIETDGDLPVIYLEQMPPETAKDEPQQEDEPQKQGDEPEEERKALAKIPRPPELYISAVLMVLLMVSAVLTMVFQDSKWAGPISGAPMGGLQTLLGEGAASWVLVAADIAVIVLVVALGIGMWNGYGGARTALMLVLGADIIYVGWKWVAGGIAMDLHALSDLTVAILLLVALTSTPVSDFAGSMAGWRRSVRAERTKMA